MWWIMIAKPLVIPETIPKPLNWSDPNIVHKNATLTDLFEEGIWGLVLIGSRFKGH